jgi:ribosomal protein S18 acetylase RimI-like enzyme
MQTAQIHASGITFRAVNEEDQEFLLHLYSTTRAEEIEAWGWPEAQARLFLEMQFTARQRSYQAMYPGATYTLILKDGQPVGQQIVDRDAKTIRLIDIALLPACRRAGIGTLQLRNLIEESRSRKVDVELKVLKSNIAAARLYERMGFIKFDKDAMYYEMIRNPE